MHGNEATGRVLLTWLISHFCDNKQSHRIQRLLETTEIYIIPSINPDGFAKRLASSRRDTTKDYSMYTYGRYTHSKNGADDNIDLNRDFPDAGMAYIENPGVAFNQTYFKSDQFRSNYEQNSQSLESEIMQEFYDTVPLDYVLNFHDGAQVVSYPLDVAPGKAGSTGVYSASPDDETYRTMSHVYADEWGDRTSVCARGIAFNGVTNGAHWYSLNGGMQDYSYLVYGTIHITIEVSCVKFPTETELTTIINNNSESLLAWMDAVSDGSFPKVYTKSSNYPNTRIQIMSIGINPPVTVTTVTDTNGGFVKVLPFKGRFNLSVSQKSRNFTVSATALELTIDS